VENARRTAIWRSSSVKLGATESVIWSADSHEPYEPNARPIIRVPNHAVDGTYRREEVDGVRDDVLPGATLRAGRLWAACGRLWAD
jgi:hypothetical protein